MLRTRNDMQRRQSESRDSEILNGSRPRADYRFIRAVMNARPAKEVVALPGNCVAIVRVGPAAAKSGDTSC